MTYRIIDRMKVTAILPDELVEEVRRRSQGENLTDCLVIALEEWRRIKKLRELNQKVAEHPLKFGTGLNAHRIRSVNRKAR